eukprot:TRINITY_DN9381_c0_g1_i2.p2 TRINITY_DN9381_c0_g1~~TRINITY_DN9381_c0_g1_i2.p2  ORF type:complete len:171 (-),score=7.45 TRINITY_DN9381_c0_g1_i2:1173-1685(-)
MSVGNSPAAAVSDSTITTHSQVFADLDLAQNPFAAAPATKAAPAPASNPFAASSAPADDPFASKPAGTCVSQCWSNGALVEVVAHAAMHERSEGNVCAFVEYMRMDDSHCLHSCVIHLQLRMNLARLPLEAMTNQGKEVTPQTPQPHQADADIVWSDCSCRLHAVVAVDG